MFTPLHKVRLDADPADKTGGDPAPTPPPAPPAVDKSVLEKLTELSAKVAELTAGKERAEKSKEEAVAAERAKAAEELGKQTGEAKVLADQIKEIREKAAAAEAERAKERTVLMEDKVDAVVKLALSGVALLESDAARRDAERSARDLVEAKLVNGRVVVVVKGTDKDALEHLRTEVAGKDFAHYRKASAKGGTNSQGGDIPTPTEPQKSAADKVLEAAAAAFKTHVRTKSFGT